MSKCPKCEAINLIKPGVCKECFKKAYTRCQDTDREYDIVKSYAKMKVEEIAKRFGISHQAVAQKISRAEKKGLVDYAELKKKRKKEAIKPAVDYVQERAHDLVKVKCTYCGKTLKKKPYKLGEYWNFCNMDHLAKWKARVGYHPHHEKGDFTFLN